MKRGKANTFYKIEYFACVKKVYDYQVSAYIVKLDQTCQTKYILVVRISQRNIVLHYKNNVFENLYSIAIIT